MNRQEIALRRGMVLLDTLAAEFGRRGDVFTLPGRGLQVAEPALAKAVLANPRGDYREHSDFFFTSRGFFLPREAQQQVGRAARDLLTSYLAAGSARLPRLVDAHLAPASCLPDAANHLLYDFFGPALLGERTAPPVRAAIDQGVRHAVLAGGRYRRGPLRRALLRGRTHYVLAKEIDARRRRRRDPDRDLLEVVATAAAEEHPATQVGEVFVSLLFAMVGATGFLLSWSLYLLGTQPPRTAAAPTGVVREALRLWPVAWLFGRSAARPHRLGPAAIEAQQRITVCTYLIHRHPGYWPDPDEFRPGRWAGGGHPAYLPFGAGPHACAGASVVLGLVTDLLRTITTDYRMSVRVDDPRPRVGPALVPPPFQLRLWPRTATGRR